jgi:chromosome segregation ATPase
MSPQKKVMILLVIGLLGAWGCAQGPTNGSASAERLRALEAKISRLEDDFKSAVAVREQMKKKVATLEDEKNVLGQQVEQLQAVVKERDEIKNALASRTSERDLAQTQLESFRKGLKNLLGQMETASTTPAPAANRIVPAAATVTAPGKS